MAESNPPIVYPNPIASATDNTPKTKEEWERLKAKEQWLREEIRHSRSTMTATLRWGITVLTGVETALYFIRKDVIERHHITPDQPFPFLRWIVGTAVQLFLAFVFWQFMSYVLKTHRNYRDQLTGMNPSYSGIMERPTGTRVLPRMAFWLYMAYPIADLLLWLYLLALKEHTININFNWNFLW